MYSLGTAGWVSEPPSFVTVTSTSPVSLAGLSLAPVTVTGGNKLKATFTNEDRILWPGTFVNVALMLDSRDNAIVVPSEAIQAGQDGQFVYVVKPDQTVESRKVTVGAAVGRKVVVQSGVKQGETRLLQTVSDWVKSNLKNGKLNEIYKKYHGNDLPEVIVKEGV